MKMIKNRQYYDVAIIGRNCIDYIFVIDNYPEENSKKSIIEKCMEAGGQGSTSACCVSKLGGKTAFFGNLGSDHEGQFCLKRLEDFNVGVGNVKIYDNYKTPAAYIFVNRNNGSRTIFFEERTLPEVSIKQISKDIISSAKVILLDPETTHLAIELKQFLNKEAKIVYDCERWRNGIEYLYETADYFVLSYEFLKLGKIFSAQYPFLDKISELRKKVKGELIITHGEHGAYFVSDNLLYNVPALKVDVLDTIGAGDNFHAAFSFAISQNYDLVNAVKFSVAVASLSCRKHGGREGIPYLDYAMDQAKNLKPVFLRKM